MAKSINRNRHKSVPGDPALAEMAGGLDSGIMGFANLLDGGKISAKSGSFTTDHVHVSIDHANDALVLTIHHPQDDRSEPTVVTLAGLGAEYAAYDGLQLSDIIKGLGS